MGDLLKVVGCIGIEPERLLLSTLLLFSDCAFTARNSKPVHASKIRQSRYLLASDSHKNFL
jgi:hypothetical protein